MKLRSIRRNIGTYLIICLLCYSIDSNCQIESKDTLRSFTQEAFLHPIDCISPYTLNKGEWIYAQSIQTLPFPSWAFFGITDKLTAQIDLLPWIYGLFTEERKPIPSINFRYRFNEQKAPFPTIGIEAMFVHFWDTLKRFETPTLSIWENGSYFHIKPVIGYQFKDHWNVNMSIGIDYIAELIMKNNDTLNFNIQEFTNSWNPNFSLCIDYRPSSWISYHLGFTYGSTLTYLENVPRKKQFTYGFRMVPFRSNRFKILRSMRIELVAINASFPDIKAKQHFPIPVFPYFYWQF